MRTHIAAPQFGTVHYDRRMTSIDFDSLVVNFLECVKEDERPYRRLADLLMLLHSQGWSPDELLRVQSVFYEAITQHRDDEPRQQGPPEMTMVEA